MIFFQVFFSNGRTNHCDYVIANTASEARDKFSVANFGHGYRITVVRKWMITATKHQADAVGAY